jgi:prepilin-type processing-associated H-X9-DG protein
VKIYQCPSSPGHPRFLPEVVLFATGGTPTGCRAAVGDYFTTHSVSDPRLTQGHPFTGNTVTALDDNNIRKMTAILDGTSNTLLVSEQAGRPDFWVKGVRQPTNAALTANTWWGPWAGYNSFTTQCFTDDGLTIGGNCSINCQNGQGPYSFHTGGCNTVFCDGSVRFLRVGMNPFTLFALVTREGGVVVAGNDL